MCDNLTICLHNASNTTLKELKSYFKQQGWVNGLNWLNLCINTDFNALMHPQNILINKEKHIQSIIECISGHLRRNNVGDAMYKSLDIAYRFVDRLITRYLRCYEDNNYNMID